MLASRLLTNGMSKVKHGLAHVAKRILGVEGVDKEQQRSDWSGDLSQERLDYAAKDVELLCEVDHPIHQQIAQEGLGKAYALECSRIACTDGDGEHRGCSGIAQSSSKWRKTMRKTLRTSEESFILSWMKHFLKGTNYPRDPDGSFNLRKNYWVYTSRHEAVRRFQHRKS